MKINLFYVIIAIAAILILSIGAVYIVNLSTVMDKTPAIEKRLTGLFAKFSLSDKNLIKKYLEIKKLGIRRYVHMYREYDVPKAFAVLAFGKELKKSLGWSG
ncbi:MAG: hypothetical protein Q8Q87_00975, partial [Candidatus Omnitrophota bacterium]|nr:hypothetical protein [Candidatus Omnitrophota bacterium]